MGFTHELFTRPDVWTADPTHTSSACTGRTRVFPRVRYTRKALVLVKTIRERKLFRSKIICNIQNLILTI